ncbi:MAG: AarF/ABC1/UbiB kinase family protein [Gammaproteobacteria bacterium]|jgi:ubiquinone biosynthesis protein
MNWIQFGRLIHSIYSRNGKLPDLDWIQRQGLLAVKLGQVHALRIDLLDPKKCEHLAQLYRRTSPLPSEDFFSLLDNSGIDAFTAAFDSIEESSLAAASVGQVHRGRLEQGDEVVIKAVKADFRRQFKADIKSLKRLFRLATRVYPPLRHVGNPVAILEDLEAMTSAELNLRNELKGQERLRQIHAEQSRQFDLSRLKFPTAYPGLSNENVLVTQFIDAPSVDELLDDDTLRYEQLLDLFRIHGFYMFVIGTFHGDLHPGNVLVDDGDFYFIDTAYIGTVSDRLRRGLFSFFEALTRYDYSGCAESMHSMSTAQLSEADFQRFENALLEVYKDFKGATVSEVSLTTKMMQTIKLAVRSGMSFDSGMFGIIRSLMYLDGMVLRCKPDADLIRDMREPVEEMLDRFPALGGTSEREAEPGVESRMAV